MPETKAGPAEGAMCLHDPATQEDDYITVSVRLRASTVADIHALAPKSGRGKASFDTSLRLCAEAGLLFWKGQEGKGTGDGKGGSDLDGIAEAEPDAR